MIDDLIGEWIKGILIDGIKGNLSGPVSYTHLDVYKRQIPHRKRVICAAVRPFHPFAEERLAGQRGTDIHCLPHSRDSGNAG